VAVSGGVDSSALAFLLQRHFAEENAARNKQAKSAEIGVFIVDHKTRPESTKEAEGTADRLRSILGFTPKIITLQWPEGVEPSRLRNFESQARRLRYRALGKACRQYKISHLLLGHHADDVAETVLTRLSDGHARGLYGISNAAQIPECEGIHEVYESGSVGANRPSQNSPYLIEDGGVSIARPLLSFPKSRLIQTCHEAGIVWAEDKTNHDPTFTQRNAARALLQSSKLPAALRTDALLKLSNTFHRLSLQEFRHVQRLMNACQVKRFDIRSGMLHIKFPRFDEVITETDGPSMDLTSKHRIAMSFARQVLDMVSSHETIQLKKLAVLPGLFFPGEFSFPHPKQSKYTFGGVLIAKSASWNRKTSRDPAYRELKSMEWLLCRQPYESNKNKLPISLFAGANAVTNLPCDEATAEKFLSPYGTPDILTHGFSLWDGRFWIHVTHEQSYPLLVVPLTPPSRDKLIRKFARTPFATKFTESHRECTIDTARFTIPVIVTPPGAEIARGTVVAAPTLGLIRPGWETKVRWDIRYKKIPFDNLTKNEKKPYLRYHAAPLAMNVEES
jgi:tRNA(Ile)-lysidine synthase